MNKMEKQKIIMATKINSLNALSELFEYIIFFI